LYVTLERKGVNIRWVNFQIYDEEVLVYTYGFRKEGEWIHFWVEESKELEIFFEVYPFFGRRAPLRRARWFPIRIETKKKFPVRIGITKLLVENAKTIRLRG